jgi:hypothetical protein
MIQKKDRLLFLNTYVVFPLQDHSTNASHLSSHYYYQKDERAKPGTLKKKQCSFGLGTTGQKSTPMLSLND